MTASEPSPPWFLLVVSLPTSSATARMRLWRALKALGCAALRDGAYLMPANAQNARALQELGDACRREGGSAWLMDVQPRSAEDAGAYRRLFDRSADYAELRMSWKQAQRGLSAMAPVELARLQRKLLRAFESLRGIDFFPNEATAQAEAAWTEFSRRLDRLLAPDEPQDGGGDIPRLRIADYQGRTWATRRRLWVDRVASAWLIRRFIDQGARFQWLAQPSDCPKRALGFDFDGAMFTHVGDRVTFETLLASFGLDADAALVRIGAIVHALDVGGETVPEASGLEAIMAGARARTADDDALLAEMGSVLDSLYAHFCSAARQTDGAARDR